jgi:hypothetical protein
MKKLQLARPSLLFIVAFVVFCSPSLAQHFVKMTAEQRIELALDMIRKGIQQQDTTKILMVLAPEISTKGAVMKSRADFSRELQTIFGSSHNRQIALQKPAFPRTDNPLHLSNFWDFDILDPKITIEGDSAVVECELVLWGALPGKGSRERGSRVKERFVFKTPPEVQGPSPPGEYHRLPVSPSGKKDMASIRSWKLVASDTLSSFLNNEIEKPRE